MLDVSHNKLGIDGIKGLVKEMIESTGKALRVLKVAETNQFAY
jgi:hypothetical protein